MRQSANTARPTSTPLSERHVFLLGSDHDWSFWSERAHRERFRTVGFPRYDPWWIETVTGPQLLENSPELQLARSSREMFFLIMRGPDLEVIRPEDREYLRVEDYDYLVEAISRGTLDPLPVKAASPAYSPHR